MLFRSKRGKAASSRYGAARSQPRAELAAPEGFVLFAFPAQPALPLDFSIFSDLAGPPASTLLPMSQSEPPKRVLLLIGASSAPRSSESSLRLLQVTTRTVRRGRRTIAREGRTHRSTSRLASLAFPVLPRSMNARRQRRARIWREMASAGEVERKEECVRA